MYKGKLSFEHGCVYTEEKKKTKKFSFTWLPACIHTLRHAEQARPGYMLEELTGILTASDVGKSCGYMSAFLGFVLYHSLMCQQSERGRSLGVTGWHHPHVSFLMIPSIRKAILIFVSLKETSTLYIEVCVMCYLFLLWEVGRAML